MKRFLGGVLLLAIGACGCASTDTIHQGSTMTALMGGLYDGAFPSSQIKAWGDFGIGTFDRLDGELVLLDGQVYQIRSDGQVVIKKSYTAPFATIKKFQPEEKIAVPCALNFTELKGWLDAKIFGLEVPVAIRVDGEFDLITLRSVPPQDKPYRKLADIVKGQSVFEKRHVTGTLVGFRFPADAQGMNVAGYHFHFISQDRTVGGHVLDARMTQGAVQIDRAGAWSVVFPASREHASGLFQKDGSVVKRVEVLPAE